MAPEAGEVSAGQEEPEPPASEPTSSRASTLTLGIIIGITEVSLATSFAALIFAGPLSEDLAAGVGLGLLSAAVTLTVVALWSSGGGSVGSVQDISAAVLAVMAASMVTRMPLASEERFFTVVLMIGLTSLVTGAVFWVVGRFGWGNIVRFAPHPVIGGFVAGTGWLIFRGGFSLLADVPLSVSNVSRLLEAEVVARWLPGVALGLVVLLLLTRRSHPLIIPGAVVVGASVFYAVLFASGGTVQEAEAGGWLLGPFPAGSLWRTWLPAAAADGNWSAALSQTGTLPSLVLLALVALLLNVSGIEVATEGDVDVNRELRVAGGANLAGGLGGALIGFHSPTLTLLPHRAGAQVRIVGLIAAAASALALLFGAAVLGLAPKLVIGGLLVFLGLDLLLEWVVRARTRLPMEEYVLVLVILLAIAAFGFLAGVVLGVVAALVLFAVNYSRTDVVKHVLSGQTYQSKVERSPAEQAILQQAGEEIYILELQGFVFFGTAFGLLAKVRDRLAEPSLPGLRFVILDFQRVSGLDSSAALSFKRAHQQAAAEQITLVLTGLSEPTRVRLERNGLRRGESLSVHSDLDHGVEWCEEQILKGEALAKVADESAFPGLLQELLGQDIDPHELLVYLERVDVPPGRRLIQQGDPPGDVYFLATGRLTATLDREDGSSVRLRTMGPGTVVGEIALYLGTPRTASVATDVDSVVYRLSSEAMARMEQTDSQLAAALHGCFARLLALRLAGTLRTVDALLS